MPIFIRVASLLPFTLLACGPATVDPSPLPFDGGTIDSGVDSGLADGGVSVDAMVIDAGPGDESIRGTSLEGVQIEWPDRLELCSRWREGRTADEERAVKVHVTLLPQARASLGDGHLARSSLEGGTLRRGPLADAQTSIGGGATRLLSYDLRRPDADSSLFAEIEHVLPAGSIIESFNVSRARGDPRPVTLSDFNEHFFAFKDPGTGEIAFLERCGGEPSLDNGIFALDLEYQGRRAALIRFARTQLAAAGSAPLVPTGGMLIFADTPYDPIFFAGFWSQIYVAQHHNFEDASRFDFTADLSLFETVYEPHLRQGTPIRSALVTRVDLAGVDSFGPAPKATLTTLDLATDRETVEEWSASDWVRADDAAVLGGFNDCAPAQAITLTGTFSTILQLVGCPIAAPPGFDVRAVQPVVFLAERGVAGQMITGAAITPITDQGRSGYRIQIGTHRIVLTKVPSDPYWFFELFDAQGQSLESRLDADVDLDLPPRDETLVTQATGVRATVVRRWAAQGVGESSIFAPLSFELTFDGATHRVEAWDRLDYTNSHHNWADRLVAKGDGLTMLWRVDWEQGPLVYRVSATRDADGVVVLPETVLAP